MGRTWLDEELALRSDVKPRDGFGAEVKAAKEKRLAFLREQKFLKTSERLTQNVLKQLEARDLKAAGAKLSKEIGKPYFITAEKGQLTGVLVREYSENTSVSHQIILTSQTLSEGLQVDEYIVDKHYLDGDHSLSFPINASI